MCNKNSKQIIASLNRIAGQVRGVGQMVEDERYCIDILNQIHAVKAALSKVENQVLRSHAACCVEEAIASERPIMASRPSIAMTTVVPSLIGSSESTTT